jgi:hypothetical protein
MKVFNDDDYHRQDTVGERDDRNYVTHTYN